MCDQDEIPPIDPTRARLHNSLGKAYEKECHWELARENMELDVRICAQLGEKTGEAKARLNLGDLYFHKEEYDVAEKVGQGSESILASLDGANSLCNFRDCLSSSTRIGFDVCPPYELEESIPVMRYSSCASPLLLQHMKRARDIIIQMEDEGALLEMCDNNLQTIRAARESAAEFQQLMLKHKKNQRAFTRARCVDGLGEMDGAVVKAAAAAAVVCSSSVLVDVTRSLPTAMNATALSLQTPCRFKCPAVVNVLSEYPFSFLCMPGHIHARTHVHTHAGFSHAHVLTSPPIAAQAVHNSDALRGHMLTCWQMCAVTACEHADMCGKRPHIHTCARCEYAHLMRRACILIHVHNAWVLIHMRNACMLTRVCHACILVHVCHACMLTYVHHACMLTYVPCLHAHVFVPCVCRTAEERKEVVMQQRAVIKSMTMVAFSAQARFSVSLSSAHCRLCCLR